MRANTEADRTPYLDRLAEALGMPHMSFGQATEDGYFGAFGYGNAVLSRYRIVSEEHTLVKADAKHQVRALRLPAYSGEQPVNGD